jgi:hypothetical protein
VSTTVVSIYGLVDPRTNQLRYVGKTKKSLHKRLKNHVQDARYGFKRHVCNWVGELLRLGLRPEIFVIEEVAGDWAEAERFWIAYFRSIGAHLTNIAKGGQGDPGPEHFEKLRVLFKGRVFSEEHKRKIREGIARSRAERSAAVKAVWADPAYRAKMRGHLDRLAQMQRDRWAKYRAERELQG